MATNVMAIPPGGGQKLWFLGKLAIHLARGEHTDGMYTLGCGDVAEGDGPPPHIQRNEDEAFYVLAGTFEFLAGNQRLTADPNTFVTIRAGTAHTFRCVGAGEGRLLIFCSPAGFDRFQIETGEPFVNGQPMPLFDPAAAIARIMAAAPNYGIDMNPPAEAFTIAPAMRVASPSDGPAYGVGGSRYRILAGGADTGGRFACLEVTMAPGRGSPPHRHAFVAEGIYVLEGDVEFTFGTNRVRLKPSAFYHVPAGRGMRFQNVGSTPARMLAFAVPAGLERFIADVGTVLDGTTAPAPAPTPADLERLVNRAPLCGIEILAR